LRRNFAAFIIVTLIPALTLFSPTTLAQAGEASATFEIRGGILTLTITSPVDVAEFQVSIKASSTVDLASSQATLTGFMAGASHLSLKGVEENEFRWFNLQSPGGKTGVLSIPVSNIGAGVSITLERADLLGADGSKIPVPALPRGVVLVVTSTSTTTVTTTTTTTSTVRVTSTTTTTATSTTTVTFSTTTTTTTTATSTRTLTQTTTQTTTSTSMTTSTATATTTTTSTMVSKSTTTATTTTTVAATSTRTETVEVLQPVAIAALAFSIAVIIVLAILLIMKRRP